MYHNLSLKPKAKVKKSLFFGLWRIHFSLSLLKHTCNVRSIFPPSSSISKCLVVSILLLVTHFQALAGIYFFALLLLLTPLASSSSFSSWQ